MIFSIGTPGRPGSPGTGGQAGKYIVFFFIVRPRPEHS